MYLALFATFVDFLDQFGTKNRKKLKNSYEVVKNVQIFFNTLKNKLS